MECYFKSEISNKRLPCPIYNLSDCRVKNYPPSCTILEVQHKYVCHRWKCASTTTTMATTTSMWSTTTTMATTTTMRTTSSTTTASTSLGQDSFLGGVEDVLSDSLEFWNDQVDFIVVLEFFRSFVLKLY